MRVPARLRLQGGQGVLLVAAFQSLRAADRRHAARRGAAHPIELQQPRRERVQGPLRLPLDPQRVHEGSAEEAAGGVKGCRQMPSAHRARQTSAAGTLVQVSLVRGGRRGWLFEKCPVAAIDNINAAEGELRAGLQSPLAQFDELPIDHD